MKGFLLTVFIFGCLNGLGESTIVETIVTTVLSDCTAIKSLLGVTYGQLNASNQPSPSSIKVILFDGNYTNQLVTTLPHSGNVTDPKFNFSRPTDIIIHGFLQSSLSVEIQVLVNAFIAKGTSNVVLIDANAVIGFWYMYSSTAIQFIGNYLGEQIAILVNRGYSKSNIHITGFGLGAHAAGFAGRTFKTLTGGPLPWITGLDPAGPCFFNSNASDVLDATDADFVDVIHTNMGIWGTAKKSGDIDFYPNGGTYQPAGVDAHKFALYLYAESIAVPNSFTSVGCKNGLLFSWGACSWNGRANMGYGVLKTTTGDYFTYTSGQAPFSLGESGIPAFNFFAWIASLFA